MPRASSSAFTLVTKPKTTPSDDFQGGDRTAGWTCLNFQMTTPHYYQYHYNKDAMVAAPDNPAGCTAPCYEAGAVGDLDADTTPSRFAITGNVNDTTKKLKSATQVYIEDEYE